MINEAPLRPYRVRLHPGGLGSDALREVDNGQDCSARHLRGSSERPIAHVAGMWCSGVTFAWSTLTGRFGE